MLFRQGMAGEMGNGGVIMQSRDRNKISFSHTASQGSQIATAFALAAGRWITSLQA